MIALCCHSWMVFWQASPIGILSKCIPQCISRPHWYIPSHSGLSPWCVSSYDVLYLQLGKVTIELSIFHYCHWYTIASLVQQMGPWQFQLHTLSLTLKNWKSKRIVFKLVSTSLILQVLLYIITVLLFCNFTNLIQSTIGLYTSSQALLFGALFQSFPNSLSYLVLMILMDNGLHSAPFVVVWPTS